jgi:predicted nucleic acid-binding protein
LVRFFEPLTPGAKVVSSITELEVRSAIRRRQASGDLSLAHADLAIESLSEELRNLNIHPMTSRTHGLAIELVDRHDLRALDAIQLATAVLADISLPDDAFQFVASDTRLLKAAKAEGFETWNPADDSSA